VRDTETERQRDRERDRERQRENEKERERKEEKASKREKKRQSENKTIELVKVEGVHLHGPFAAEIACGLQAEADLQTILDKIVAPYSPKKERMKKSDNPVFQVPVLLYDKASDACRCCW